MEEKSQCRHKKHEIFTKWGYYNYLLQVFIRTYRDRKDSRVEKIIQVDMNLKSNCIYLSIVYALCIRVNLKPVAF